MEQAEATFDSNAPVALVTGGARGLGLACAQRLASDGFRIALVDLDEQALRSALDQLPGGGGLHAYAGADVTRTGQVREAVDDVCARLGPPSALINAAGILRSTRFLDISEAEWDAVMDVSVKGTFAACQACIPMMRAAAHGRIVNFSSTAGKSVSTLGGAHYTTAKAALLGLTRALATEMAADGITVNAVCPGLFDTEMVRQTIDPVTLEGYVRSFPIGRLGHPWEVAALVAYLCSPQASYITGAALDINGGDLMV